MAQEWQDGFILVFAQCDNCLSGGAPTKPVMVSTIGEIEKLAENIHSSIVLKERKICANPKLTAIYQLARTQSTSLVIEKAA